MIIDLMIGDTRNINSFKSFIYNNRRKIHVKDTPLKDCNTYTRTAAKSNIFGKIVTAAQFCHYVTEQFLNINIVFTKTLSHAKLESDGNKLKSSLKNLQIVEGKRRTFKTYH